MGCGLGESNREGVRELAGNQVAGRSCELGRVLIQNREFLGATAQQLFLVAVEGMRVLWVRGKSIFFAI